MKLSGSVLSAEELKERLEEFERRYDMPSSEMAEAFTNGRLRETEELREWSHLYSTWLVWPKTS